MEVDSFQLMQTWRAVLKNLQLSNMTNYSSLYKQSVPRFSPAYNGQAQFPEQQMDISTNKVTANVPDNMVPLDLSRKNSTGSSDCASTTTEERDIHTPSSIAS